MMITKALLVLSLFTLMFHTSSGQVIISVGFSGPYQTIQEAYDSIPEPLTQSYQIETDFLYSPSSEVYPIVFRYKQGASNVHQITIKLKYSQNLFFDSLPDAMLKFDSAQYVNINGSSNFVGSTNALFSNFHEDGTVISFENNSRFNSIYSLRINGYTKSINKGIINFGDGNNSNNSVYNCLITNSNGGNCLLSKSITGENASNSISFNDIGNYISGGDTTNAIYLVNGNKHWTITNNTFSINSNDTSSLVPFHYTGLYVVADNYSLYNINNNHFNGNITTSSGVSLECIKIKFDTLSYATLNNTRISNFNISSGADVFFTGITTTGNDSLCEATYIEIGDTTSTSITLHTSDLASKLTFNGIISRNVENCFISGIDIGGNVLSERNFTGIVAQSAQYNKIGSVNTNNSIDYGAVFTLTTGRFYGILVKDTANYNIISNINAPAISSGNYLISSFGIRSTGEQSVVTNNTIRNFAIKGYGYGILTQGLRIKNNKITNFSSDHITSDSIAGIYHYGLLTTSSNPLIIDNNLISNVRSTGIARGIFIKPSPNTSTAVQQSLYVTNNSINNIVVTSSTGSALANNVVSAISVASNLIIQHIDSNSIYNIQDTVINLSRCYGIIITPAISPSLLSVNNNSIRRLIVKSRGFSNPSQVDFGLSGIYLTTNNTTPSGTTVHINNNSIDSLSITDILSKSVTGIYANVSGNEITIDSNAINNISSSSTLDFDYKTPHIAGIFLNYLSADSNNLFSISGNDLYKLRSFTPNNDSSNVFGICLSGNSANNQKVNVSRNYIHHFSNYSGSRGSKMYGILNSAPGLFSNNIIQLGVNFDGSFPTVRFNINGILNDAANEIDLIYNTIYIKSNNNLSASRTYCFKNNFPPVNDQYFNNLFYNEGSTINFGTCIYYSSATNIVSNNNCYYSTDMFFGQMNNNIPNINSITNLSFLLSGQDSNSINVNPLLAGANKGLLTADFHPIMISPLLTSGVAIPSIQIDYFGNPRNNITPTIGAIEGSVFSGFDQLKNDNLFIYPNPATSYFYIKLNDLITQYTMEVFDNNGKLILTKVINENDFLVGCEKWKKGMYLIRISNSNGSTTESKKIIIN